MFSCGLLCALCAAGGVRDVYSDFNELTLEITLEALFGIKASSAEGGYSSHHTQ